MAARTVGILMTPIEVNEGKGVTIRRTIGSDKLVLLDPFLLLDHLTVGNSGEKEIGFPRHPHRGIETLTYVISGRMHHRDSMGNDDAIQAGESQYMTAGGGLFHSEMAELGPDGHESLQIWLNLPAGGKMIPPQYRAAHTSEIPTVTTDGGASVRVIAGTFGGATGPFTGIAANPTYLAVDLPAGTSVTLPAPPGETSFAYVYQGRVSFGGKVADTAHLAIFSDGDGVTATATGDGDARFIFLSARPWNHPVLQYRSLVMSSVDEMQQALEDLENGIFEWKGG